jgi:hypothetical protein
MSEKKPPPYRKYAFANPYNYAILGGFASASLLTGNWWLGLVGAGWEALWMLFAPDSKLLQKLWFDKVHADVQGRAAQAALMAKLAQLPVQSVARINALKSTREQIDRLAHENPAFTTELLKDEFKKLDDLGTAFVDLAIAAARYDEYLGSLSLNEMEQDERRYRALVERGNTEGRALAQKNLGVVLKRKEKYAEIRGYLTSARGQMELIENTFQLLADQIVTMRSPQELGGQLDELLDGVEAVRQTARETERILQTIER